MYEFEKLDDERRKTLKTRKIVFLVFSIVVIAMLVAMACGQAAAPATTSKPAATTAPTSAPTTQVAAKEKTYNCLNPTGEFVPVQTIALSPRLTTIEGKTIVIDQGEASPVVMPALIDYLPKKYPNTKWVVYAPLVAFGRTAPEDVELKADAIIRGNAW
jgi:hypothetical protein